MLNDKTIYSANSVVSIGIIITELI